MKSGTSYFSASVFKKNTARFWPIWGAYLFIWLVVLILPQMVSFSRHVYVGYSGAPGVISQILANMSWVGIIGGFAFAVISCMAIWSYLYSPRSASFMASLPIKREGMFLTNYLTGLIWYVGANVIIAAVLAISTFAVGYPDMIGVWNLFMMITLSGLFFYSFATLLAQLTGNILMLPLIYGILNIAWIVLEVLTNEILRSFLYGYVSGAPKITALSPIVHMFTRYDGNIAGRSWMWMYIYAAVGIVFAALALLLYRRRAMESAGDVVAVRALRPVFKYFTAFSGAIVFGSALYSILGFGNYDGTGESALWPLIAIMVVMSFICCYIAEALLHKSFRVIKRGLAGFAISAVVMAAAVVALDADLFGIERRVPDADDVEYVAVNHADYYDGGLREPENISLVIEEHRDFVENREIYNTGLERGWEYFDVRYTLKNGSTLERSYRLPIGAPNFKEKSQSMKRILISEEFQRKALIAPFRVTDSDMNYMNVNYYDNELKRFDSVIFEAQEVAEFYNDYYLKDVANGTVDLYAGGQGENGRIDAHIYLNITEPRSYRAFSVSFYPNPEATHINEWFAQRGIVFVDEPDVGM